MMNFQQWTVEIDQDHIAWWKLDRKAAAVNSLNIEVFEELEILINEAEKNSSLRGIVILSGKSSGFIAGADVKQFTKIQSESEALVLTRQGQQVFNKLAAIKIPTVAVISGFCMGGGTELALACRYRIVEDSPKTRIGFPEVKLGLQPGWGGTIRLPKLIGILKAMQMILSGNSVDAKTAAKLRLVDCAVPDRHLIQAAKDFVFKKPVRARLNMLEKILNSAIARPLVAKFLRKNLALKHISQAHYPAPYKIIELWEKDGGLAKDSMDNEAKSLAHLIVSETAQNLIRVFFLQDKLKSLAKDVKFKAQRVHVVGAGTMGGDIAALCALRGLKVSLQDREPKYIAPAIKRAYELFTYKLKEPRLIQAAMDNLMPDIEGRGIEHADIIIEAIIEDAEAKQNLFALIESKAKPDAILATNTSSILLEIISKKMKNPERLIGIHFFNPAAKMLLVEVVSDIKTDKQVRNNSLAFVRQLDKLPLPVKSAPGFLVNRILMKYLAETMLLLKENISPEIIDQAMLDFGMPMGPVELADTIGLDICLSVAKHLSIDTEKFSILEKLVNQKKLGRKTGEGFYLYKNNKIQKNKIKLNTENTQAQIITERLVSSMIAEAKICLQEKIVENKDLLDAGMIFGTGFAPFRGGLLYYADKK